MWSFTYPAELKPERRGQFTVRFPDLPEAITSGRNRKDALTQAADCLEEAIAGRIADSLDLPSPSKGRAGTVGITLCGAMAAKASLWLAMREAAITQTELARRLGVDEKEVRRILNPRHATKLSRIEEALAVLGRRMVVSLAEAAA